MANELDNNLSAYKLQLQQVDAALAADPDNEDLLKLKKDLQEVIELTEELVGNQTSAVTTDFESQISTDHHWNIGDKCLAPWSRDQHDVGVVRQHIQLHPTDASQHSPSEHTVVEDHGLN